MLCTITKYSVLAIIFAFIGNVAAQTQAQYEGNITFYTMNSKGAWMNSTFTNNATLLTFCNQTQNWTMITHGWEESINSTWPMAMIGNFSKNRGGCVFFMDYSVYSVDDYGTLVGKFSPIQAVLTKKLMQLYGLGFNPKKGHLFGFSFGSQLTFEGAYQFFNQSGVKIARADCCDPAGPDFILTSPSVVHAKNCADNVQCIHTSCGYGTCDRYCQKDVNMGDCGTYQVGQTSPPLLSHGMCPHIYSNAFVVPFQLVSAKVASCTPITVAANITGLPPLFAGFNLNMSLPNQEYYALTGTKYPWNVV